MYSNLSHADKVFEIKINIQGLLEKDCKKRQDWDTIISHEYIKSDARIQELAKIKVEFTKNLTESQEIRKEIQRHEKAKNSKKAFSH